MASLRRPLTTVTPGWFRSATKLFVLLALVVLGAREGSALVDGTSVDLGTRTQGWQDAVHVAARACGAVFEPSSTWNSPAGTIRVYFDYASFQAASGAIERTGRCVFDVLARTLHVYCPPGAQVVVVANPKLAASVFNLRGFTAWTTGTNPYQVYGYYCSSSGCYGNSDGSVTLDGTASPDSFQTEVKVYCTK